MATQKQIAANRLNAQLSTGPRTEQGKAIARMNALKSGIDARGECSTGEDPAELAALAAEYDREFLPIGLVERLIVDGLIGDDWLLRRYRFLNADLVKYAATLIYETKRGNECGGGFCENTEAFRRLHRNNIDTKRSYFTHLAELKQRQEERRRYHLDEVSTPLTDSAQTPNPEIGFVSQPTTQPTAKPEPGAQTPAPTPTQPVAIGFIPQPTPQPAPKPQPAIHTPAHPRRVGIFPPASPVAGAHLRRSLATNPVPKAVICAPSRRDVISDCSSLNPPQK